MLNNLKAVAATTALAGIIALAGASESSAYNVGTLGTPIGSGSMAITATAPSSRLTATVGGAILNCVTTKANATIGTGSFANTFPANISTNVQPLFSGAGGPPADCVGPVGTPFSVSCTNTAKLQILGLPVGGVTQGRLIDIDCAVTFTVQPTCTARVTGSVNGSYTNPTASPSAPGRLTIFAANQSLTVGPGCPANLLGQGGATFTSTSAGNLVYTLDGAPTTHPVIS